MLPLYGCLDFVVVLTEINHRRDTLSNLKQMITTQFKPQHFVKFVIVFENILLVRVHQSLYH